MSCRECPPLIKVDTWQYPYGRGDIKVIGVDHRLMPEGTLADSLTDIGAVYQEVVKTYGADSVGVYQTPYDSFGRLGYEMWRACRLVVDTGIHSHGIVRRRLENKALVNSF